MLAHGESGGQIDAEEGLEPRISAALARLEECDQSTAGAQVEVFVDIHRRLAEVLADPRAQA